MNGRKAVDNCVISPLVLFPIIFDTCPTKVLKAWTPLGVVEDTGIIFPTLVAF